MKNDLGKLGWDIRLKMHYLDEPTHIFSETPAFKVPSSWTSLVRDTQLEINLSELEEEILKIDEAGQNSPNLTQMEREPLQDLMYDKNIFIKPADKGNANVIWDKQDYLKECQLQLGHKSVYEEVETGPLQGVMQKIRNTISDMLRKKEIDKKLFNYLLVKPPQLGCFYLLLKIHKRMTNVPGRPVIFNNGTSTENRSSYLDYHLKSLIPQVPHILEDTRDFVNRIQDLLDLAESSILVSFDVVDLYPHITHEEGIETMAEYLETRDDKTVSTKSLCDLASIVLKGNYFKLSSKIYHQKLGTAIGTKFASSNANLFMAGQEKRIFENSGYHLYLWLRFSDDIICIWTDGLEKLQDFFEFLNAFHPTIKFTMDYSYETINFLDVQVCKKNSTLETDLYCKDTNRHQYLHAKSCHRYVYKKYIRFGQAIRLKE